MSDDFRSRAAAMLKLPVDATAAEAANAFLAKLPDADFAPEPDSVAAFNSLAGLAVPNDADATPTLREEVEEFARRYWSLAPAERMASWLTLSSRSPDDATAERLVSLQTGLELPGTPFPNAATEQVIAIVRELYALSPRERSIRRNRWLLFNAHRHNELVAIAAEIQKNQPAWANLEPVLMTRLTARFDARAFLDAATTTPQPERREETPEGLAYPSLAKYYTTPAPERKPASEASKTPDRAVIGILCFLLFLASKFFGVLGGCSHTSPPLPEVPQAQRDYSALLESRYYTREQVDKFRDYEQNKDTGKQAPPYYTTWCLAGKPEPFDQKSSGTSSAPINASSKQNTIHFAFDAKVVQGFKDYEAYKSGFRPRNYRLWLELGRPEARDQFWIDPSRLE